VAGRWRYAFSVAASAPAAVLRLQLVQAANIVGLKRAEPLAPRVDGLLADPVPLGHRGDLIAIRLTQDRHDLLVRKPRLAHASLRQRRAASQEILGPKLPEQVTA
jgi:hypothetical protein